MLFKDDLLKDELAHTPTGLQVMAEWFDQLSTNHFGIPAFVTRVFESIPGSSGVHEAHRAVDFRDQHDGTYLYTAEQTEFLVSEMNRRFPRKDGKLTCIHHSFQGNPYHHHVQISLDPNTVEDLGFDCNSANT